MTYTEFSTGKCSAVTIHPLFLGQILVWRAQQEPDFLEKKYFELLGLESKHTQSICDAWSEY